MFEKIKVSQTVNVTVSVVAGVMYHSTTQRLSKISELDELPLEREPGNPWDSRAIRVIHDGALLGYVPKEFAQIFAPLMDAKMPLQACVDEVIPGKGIVTMLLFVPKTA
jgi:hypothetical protein